MINIKRGVTVAALALGVAQSMPALATNGTNSEGFGPKDRGMGGAGVARATETQSIVNNPAAVVNLPSRMDIALGLFSPNNRGFTITGNNLDPDGPGPAAPIPGALDQSQTSDKDIFPIPFFGYSSRIDNDSAWAFTLSALGGLNTNYSDNFASSLGFTGDTGVDLRQMFMGATYGSRLDNGVSWGVTLSYDLQQFEAKGLQIFGQASSDPTTLTDNGAETSTGFGLKVGMQGPISGGGSWGVSYRMKSEMSEFDDYAGLFPNQGELDIAPTLTAGIALPVGDNATFAIDYHFIDYEKVDAISNSTSIFLPPPFGDGLPFGADDGPGFGWKSISVIKLGMEWETSETMTWRAGVNIGEDPLTTDEFSTAFLVPATPTQHLTAGFTKALDESSEISAVWVHTPNGKESGPFSFAFGGGTLDTEMEQNFIEVSYGMLF